jgi:competence protein ComEC
MPPAGVLVPITYGAGLATGLLHFGAPAGVAAIIAAVLLRRRDPRLPLSLGAFVFGVAAATLALAQDRWRCAALLPEGRVSLEVRLRDPASGRGLARAVVVDSACRGSIDLRWGAGDGVRAGTHARVQGRWVRRAGLGGRPGGMLLVSSADTVRSDPGPSERARNAVAARARLLYGSRAPLVDALVLGTRGSLDPALRDRFAFSGLVHLLSISGFHVGLISAWVVLVFRLGGTSRGRALAAGATVAVAYVAFLGWPAPGTRAAALTAFLALLFHRQRCADPNALLAQTCLVVTLIDPWAVFDLGGWLSAAALWGATTATRWSDARFGEGFFPRTLASSVGATLATAPITAAMLGAVAVIGVALNFIAIPLAALAVPGVVASLLVEPLWRGLAAALAGGAGLLLHLLELLADAGSRVPGGHLVLAEEPRSALPWAAALAAALWAIGRRNTWQEAARRALLLAGIWAWLSLASELRPIAGNAERGLTLHFLDVGQGDGAAIRTPGGRWLLVDLGPRSAGSDAGRRVVAPFLARHGVRRLEMIVLSHGHLDHLGGGASVLDRFRTGIVLDPAAQVPDPAYTGFLDEVEAAGVAWRAARAGTTFELDGVRFAVLHPDTTWTEWGTDVNEDSIVLRVEFGGFSALFAGDAGLPAEARLRGRVGAADLLKVGHHGSRGSSGEAWLDEVSPTAAIVSVGRNRYGHPAPEALARLIRHGADVWRTDREGTVSVMTDGKTMTLRGRRGAVTYPVE